MRKTCFLILRYQLKLEVKADSVSSLDVTTAECGEGSMLKKNKIGRFVVEDQMVYPPYMSVRSIADDMGKVRNGDGM